MDVKNDLLYSKSHEWAKVEGDVIVIGLTDYAVKELGDIVFIDLPEADFDVSEGDAVCEVESVKAVSEVFAPIDGNVCEINSELADAPEKISDDPYGSWIFRMKGKTDSGFLTAEEYSEFCESL